MLKGIFNLEEIIEKIDGVTREFEKMQNTCEGCGKQIEKIGICPACEYLRECNREKYTGVPGDKEVMKNYLEKNGR